MRMLAREISAIKRVDDERLIAQMNDPGDPVARLKGGHRAGDELTALPVFDYAVVVALLHVLTGRCRCCRGAPRKKDLLLYVRSQQTRVQLQIQAELVLECFDQQGCLPVVLLLVPGPKSVWLELVYSSSITSTRWVPAVDFSCRNSHLFPMSNLYWIDNLIVSVAEPPKKFLVLLVVAQEPLDFISRSFFILPPICSRVFFPHQIWTSVGIP